MAVENPPLNRIYVLGYSANDRDFPLVSMNLDPRVAGYKVPEDLSTCPDKRYPNHVFTGSQPLSGDERVRHVWEILPSPTVPFTRYDDDLGPVQGRRRSVKNEGQVASLTADKRITYEAREGSAIVYTELEESWSVATDEDGNSLFPFKDRDFYDASRGPVQERRQLFTPTGEEEGSLENVNGVITQTSYEPYNEFLSVKVVQTYKVDGPQLIGRATDNDGQLITVTTQRKGADSYIPPNPTATRTVEVNREDAETLVERIVDTPEVFKANTFSVERPDPIPQKFRVAVPIQTSQEVVAGQAELPELSEGEISRNEEQRNKFIKRVSSTSRDQAVLPQTLTGKSTNNERQEVVVTETLQLGNTDETPTATKTVESEALGDGNYVITKTQVDEVFGAETFRKTKEDLTPQKFRAAQEDTTFEETIEGVANPNITLSTGEFAKSEQQVNKFVKRVATTSRAITEAVTLVEKVLTPEGLVATRVLTLASGDQAFIPDALTVEANVEALGDGRTVKTETKTDRIFGANSFTVERLDPLPSKFRVKLNTKTSQFNTTFAGPQFQPTLNLDRGEISKTEQAVSAFIKRVSTVSRDNIGLTTIDGSTVYTSELGGGVAEITETFTQDVVVTGSGGSTGIRPALNINPQFGTISAERENLGNDQFIIKEVKLPTPLPILKGQDYDEALDVAIPYTRQFVEAGTELPDNPSNINPQDTLHSVVTEFGFEEARERLLNVSYKTATIESVSLPDRLVSASIQISFDSSGDDSTGSGNSGSASVGVEVSGDADLLYQIEDGYSGVVDGESYLFFLPKEECTFSNILNKLNGAEKWPTVRPRSYRFYIPIKSERKSASVSLSLPNNISRSNSGSVSTAVKTLTIPPTIHGSINLSSDITGDPLKTATAGVNSPTLGLVSLEVTAQGTVSETSSSTITATSPPVFPTGRFLYRLETSPFKFGLVRVNAVVVEITSAMV